MLHGDGPQLLEHSDGTMIAGHPRSPPSPTAPHCSSVGRQAGTIPPQHKSGHSAGCSLTLLRERRRLRGFINERRLDAARPRHEQHGGAIQFILRPALPPRPLQILTTNTNLAKRVYQPHSCIAACDHERPHCSLGTPMLAWRIPTSD